MAVIKAQAIRPDGSIKPSMVRMKNGMIQTVATIPLSQCQTDQLLCPGMIDWQVNGAAGLLFNDMPDVVTLANIGDTLIKFGTTSWLPTLVTDSLDKMKEAADAIAQGVQDPKSGVVGIHFEGPHISQAKKGIHAESHVRPISKEEMAIYERDDLGVKLITLAPEQVTHKQIIQLRKKGCIVSVGHSNATFEQTIEAVAAGATCFTHLYNAMSGIQARDPGVIAAAFDSQSYYGLIADGIHVHPAMVRMAYRQNPNMTLVTDAMPPVGTNETEFQWQGKTIHRKEDRLVDEEGRLAGAYLTQQQALTNAMMMLRLGIEDALPMVTTKPAKLLGLEETHGQVEPGFVADLMLIDETAEVSRAWRAGYEL